MDTHVDEQNELAVDMYDMFFLIGILNTLMTFSLIVCYF